MSKQTVIVALRDMEHVDDLIGMACSLGKDTNTELTAMHVVEVGPGLPLDADAEILDHPGKEILARAHQVAARDFAKEINTHLVRAREAGEAIVGEAEEQAADLLILGYHRNGRISKGLFGSTVDYVAHHAPCRTLVEVPPASKRAKQRLTCDSAHLCM